MIDFIIKSTISLGILYLFYTLFLSDLKTFMFNRYFLLGSIAFSLVIPFISISVDTTVVPLPDTTGVLSIITSVEQSVIFDDVTQEKSLITTNVLLFLYLAISSFLFIRFCSNLFNIIKQIRGSLNEKKENFTLVLVKNSVLPHTFFNYVLVNDDDFQNRRIEDSLMQHELAHCNQWHSIDIVFIELLKAVLWINPFIWLMKKPIQINHEYQADNSVLANHNISKYQNTLINTVLTNNAALLVSNFNFSFTKQRLKMMTKQFSQPKALFGIIASIFTFIFIALMISCNQKTFRQNSLTHLENDKGQQIHNVHNFNPTAYNDFENIFGMGSTDSINNIVALENAFIRLFKSNEGYSKLKSPMYRVIDINIIYSKNVHDKFYKLKDSDKASEVVSAPLLSFEFLHFQSEVIKKLNADNMESYMEMTDEN